VSFLVKRGAVLLTAALVIQSAGYYAAEFRDENIPAIRPLAEFPVNVAAWQMVRETQLEKEVQEVLAADDTMSRVYLDPAGKNAASLFVAFFKSQRTGHWVHSPKNCLPGAGWEPAESGVIQVSAPGGSMPPITINRYIVARGEEKSVVLYWYQSHNRVIASEFSAKLWLVADSVRYHRSDTALVRVVVPVRDDQEAALQTGVAFVRAIFPQLVGWLPA